MRDGGQERTGMDDPTEVVRRPGPDLFAPRRTTPHRAGPPDPRPVPDPATTDTSWWDPEPSASYDPVTPTEDPWPTGPAGAGGWTAGTVAGDPTGPAAAGAAGSGDPAGGGPEPEPVDRPEPREGDGWGSGDMPAPRRPAEDDPGWVDDATDRVPAPRWAQEWFSGPLPAAGQAVAQPLARGGGAVGTVEVAPPETDDDPPDVVGPPPRRRRLSRGRKALLGVAGLLVVLIVGGAVGVHVITNRVLGDVQRIPDVFGPLDEAERPTKPAGTEKTLNFLLVGVDTRADEQTTGTAGDGDVFVPGRQRSDVIMVVHVAADRKAASVISIPRDSWVTIPGRGKNKINAAYSLGGGSLLVRTVENLTKLRIDHFAVVDFAGFKGITDSVGGIDVRIAAATGDNRGSFPAGLNHLDGDQALVYVRQRYNLPGGDLDRVRRQQNVIKALMTKAGNMGLLSNPARTLGLADSVAQAVSVDDSLSNGDLRSLTLSLRHLRSPSVKFLTAPVAGLGTEGKQSVVRLDAANNAELWRAVTDDDVAGYVRAHPTDVLGSNPR
jgi:LCP family protein required for cell wall assembly